jgi:hypothetical protein
LQSNPLRMPPFQRGRRLFLKPKGLRIYVADQVSLPSEVPPAGGPRKYWTRREIAARLVELLAQDARTLVGIAHGFSFPLRYFEQHNLPFNWAVFFEDFQRHWPTDRDHTYVDFVHDGFPAMELRVRETRPGLPGCAGPTATAH